MASPLTLAMTQIATDWAGLTPSDRTTIRYREITGANRSGTAGDRGFVWVPEPECTTVAVAGSTRWVQWTQECVLRLSAVGRSMDAMSDAVANEMQALVSVVELRTSWPAGVQDVIVASSRASVDDESGDALLVFTFDILTIEE